MHSFRLRDTAARCRKEAENSGNGRSPSAVSLETNSENSETPSVLLPHTYLWLLTFLIQKHIFSVYRYILKTSKGWRECCPAVYCDPNVYATNPIGRPHTARQHTETGKGNSPIKKICQV